MRLQKTWIELISEQHPLYLLLLENNPFFSNVSFLLNSSNVGFKLQELKKSIYF